MKKFFKTIVTICLMAIVAGTVFAFAGCNDDNNNDNNNNDAPVTSVDGYYTASLGQMTAFFRFDDASKTYYAGFYDGGLTAAGTYTIKNETYEYYTQRDGETATFVESSKTTTEYYVELSPYNDSTISSKVPITSTGIFITTTGMSYCVDMKKDATFNDPNNVEQNYRIELQKLYYENNSLKTLTLYHTKEYEDLTGELMTDGTFTIGENNTYTLKETGADSTTTLTVNENGTAAWVKDAETTVTLSTTANLYKFDGKVNFTAIDDATSAAINNNVGADKNLTASIECKDDGTFVLNVTFNLGVEISFSVLSGTYTYVGGEFTFTPESENGVSINVVKNGPSYTASIEFNEYVNTYIGKLTGTGTVTYATDVVYTFTGNVLFTDISNATSTAITNNSMNKELAAKIECGKNGGYTLTITFNMGFNMAFPVFNSDYTFASDTFTINAPQGVEINVTKAGSEYSANITFTEYVNASIGTLTGSGTLTYTAA